MASLKAILSDIYFLFQFVHSNNCKLQIHQIQLFVSNLESQYLLKRKSFIKFYHLQSKQSPNESE